MSSAPGKFYGAPQSASSKSGIPEFEHVFVVVEENQNYDDVIGNESDLPYFNSLIREYGLATNYHANTHPAVNMQVRLYGADYDLISDPIVVGDRLVLVDAIERRSEQSTRIRIPLTNLAVARQNLLG